MSTPVWQPQLNVGCMLKKARIETLKWNKSVAKATAVKWQGELTVNLMVCGSVNLNEKRHKISYTIVLGVLLHAPQLVLTKIELWTINASVLSTEVTLLLLMHLLNVRRRASHSTHRDLESPGSYLKSCGRARTRYYTFKCNEISLKIMTFILIKCLCKTFFSAWALSNISGIKRSILFCENETSRLDAGVSSWQLYLSL